MALGLLAYDIAGGDAGAVLGTALAIKMVAYIGVAPVAGAFANKVPRRALLVAMDAVRACVAVCLPFVSEVWQVYVLIFVLQSASAAFTPTFQATIPDVLPDERDYTVLTAIALVSASAAIAHPDHDEVRPVVQTPEQAARQHVIRLVAQSKLPASWTKAQAQPRRTRTAGPSEPAARRTLHVVMGRENALISAIPTAR